MSYRNLWAKKIAGGFFCASLFFALPFFAHASTTDGTIDPTNKYAWGNGLGWVNFGTAGGNVHVTATGLTGYAWSSNYGWINLAPAHAGVTNTCTGVLSGYAWGQNVGYVNFGGVSISAAGKFTGTAVVTGTAGFNGGAGLGSISFDCANCNVSTDWRYCSNGGGGGGGTSGGGGNGSGGGTGYYNGTGTTPIATSPYTPPTGSYCDAQARIGDFNCDGRVNLIDLSIFLYYYGRTDAGAARYDLSRNGTVDFPDISILMYHWTG